MDRLLNQEIYDASEGQERGRKVLIKEVVLIQAPSHWMTETSQLMRVSVRCVMRVVGRRDSGKYALDLAVPTWPRGQGLRIGENSRREFRAALREELARALGGKVTGISSDRVDWEGRAGDG